MREGKRFDFAYIDGSHFSEDVFIDLYFISRLLNQSGVVPFDDCSDTHVAKVLSFVRSNMIDSFEEMNLGPYRFGGGRSLRYQLGRAFGKLQMCAFRKIGDVQRRWNVKLLHF